MSESGSVAPIPTEHSLPYWQSARNGALALLRCEDCGRWIHYVKLQCPNCGSRMLSWSPSSGKGKLYSYSVLHRAASPLFKDKVPYVLAIIELDEGIKIMSHLVGCDPEQVRVGMEVETVFGEIDEQRAVPYFQPVSADDKG